MNKKIEEKIATKLGRTLMDVGEKSTRDCWLFGNYEPKISVELIRNINK